MQTAVVGSALAVDPKGYVLTPQTAATTVCGPAASCSAGYTVMCCTINKGVNGCPPGTFAAGWWKAADSSWCGGGYRYIVDCNASCSDCTSRLLGRQHLQPGLLELRLQVRLGGHLRPAAGVLQRLPVRAVQHPHPVQRRGGLPRRQLRRALQVGQLHDHVADRQRHGRAQRAVRPAVGPDHAEVRLDELARLAARRVGRAGARGGRRARPLRQLQQRRDVDLRAHVGLRVRFARWSHRPRSQALLPTRAAAYGSGWGSARALPDRRRHASAHADERRHGLSDPAVVREGRVSSRDTHALGRRRPCHGMSFTRWKQPARAGRARLPVPTGGAATAGSSTSRRVIADTTHSATSGHRLPVHAVAELGVRQQLGYPVSDRSSGTTAGSSSSSGGRWPTRPARRRPSCNGARYERWVELGREQGVLGYLTSDPICRAPQRWRPALRARPVLVAARRRPVRRARPRARGVVGRRRAVQLVGVPAGGHRRRARRHPAPAVRGRRAHRLSPRRPGRRAARIWVPSTI